MGKKTKNNKKNTSLSTISHSTNNSDIIEEVKEVVSKTNFSSFYSSRKNYNCMGRKNKTDFQGFVDLCMPTQKELKYILTDKLFDLGYEQIYSGDGYLYAKGTVPVLLTAHMDTVHKETIKDYYEYFDKEKEQHIISSPQGIGGDDRCGIYMILELLKTHKCSVLFCEDEEIGGVGGRKFCKTKHIEELSEMKYLIELDRANATDAVFYDCDNEKFTKFIEDNTDYNEEYGSFSDISSLSPVCKIASVNLSCGYYNAHSTSEYVIVEEMLNTIEVVRKLLDVECESFEFIKKKYSWSRGMYGNLYGSMYGHEDDYDYYYGSRNYNGGKYYSSTKSSKNEFDTCKNEDKDDDLKSLFIYVYSYETDQIETYVSNGKSKLEAFGLFFINNPEYCFADIWDFEFYDYKIYEDGWYEF